MQLWPTFFSIKYVFLLGKSSEKPIFDVNETLNGKVSLWQGDITTLEIDAIVNAGKLCIKSWSNFHLTGGDMYADKSPILSHLSVVMSRQDDLL